MSVAITPADILKSHHLKVTEQRLAVLEIFVNNNVLSLADIYKLLGKTFDRITLYRILTAFEEHGVIHKIPNSQNDPLYALCKHDAINHTHNDNHVHFKCMTCNTTFCLEKVLIPEIKIPKKFKAEKINFIVEGYCENCK